MAVVSSYTLVSRVLGLARDALLLSTLGAGEVGSAFLLAFTLPNLFRRLLGEGALTSVLIPTLTHTLEQGGRPAGFNFFNQLLLRLGSVLIVGTLLGMFFLAQVPDWGYLAPRWGTAARLAICVLPYMPLVCLSAAFSGVLNILERFGTAAGAPLWLNFTMIMALLLPKWLGYALTPLGWAYSLCAGVVVGGMVQLGLVARALYLQGWRPNFRWSPCLETQQFLHLLIPGLLGAAIAQINIGVSRGLAFQIEGSAVALLYAANRLIELPLGVFTIAIATVIFPKIARHAARQEWQALGKTYHQGLEWVLMISIPAASGLIALKQPILLLLFQWGAFGPKQVHLIEPILCIMALAIPFHSLAILSTRGLHSLKNFKTPARLAWQTFLLNVTLSLMGGWWLGTPGLALASTSTAAYQALYLRRCLHRELPQIGLHQLQRTLVAVLIGSLLMGLICHAGWKWMLQLVGHTPSKGLALAAIVLLIPLGLLLYGIILEALGLEIRQVLKHSLLRRVPFPPPKNS